MFLVISSRLMNILRCRKGLNAVVKLARVILAL